MGLFLYLAWREIALFLDGDVFACRQKMGLRGER